MAKIIHYCWFGNKPLSKKAKKCIKSWRKYFPDYKIIEWNENNFDINICPFVKEAYEKKKYAFVSDYARLYALYNYGGLYFDTDMKIISKCRFLEKPKLFFGYEQDNNIAAGVIGTSEKNNKYIKQLLDIYEQKEHFYDDQIFNYAIPKIITEAFKGFTKKTENNIDILDDNIYIYPEEYFYPINYDYSKKNFTKNTCMIHYYSATWAPKEEKIAVLIQRKFGKKLGKCILSIYYKLCKIRRKILRKDKKETMEEEKIFSNYIKNFKDYIIISHPDWIGVKNSSKYLFENNAYLREQYTKEQALGKAKILNGMQFKIIVFNGFALGWDIIAKELKQINPNIIIKVIWHGSNALLSEEYDYQAFMKILDLHNKRIIDEIGFVKKSMYEFYKQKGFRVSFIMNNVELNILDTNKEERKSDTVKIGIYCSGDRWIKNTYNQLAAASLIPNSSIDVIPLTDKIVDLASKYNANIRGLSESISHEEMLKRLASNDINVYVTFTECAPILPLESLELGVPCITGNNHHYFENTELYNDLTVDKEDNIMEIYKKILFVLENKEKIISEYRAWKKEYNEQTKKNNEMFIKTN